jgi:hypothetical protein
MGSQAVQGTAGATVAAYSDPAAPPGATVSDLLPTSDPKVAADRQQAYQALVQAATDYVKNQYPSETFNDFLDLNTGVTILPDHLHLLQDIADKAVLNDEEKYLGTASPSPALLSALQDVVNLLDRVDSERQNVMKFLNVQDSWVQNEIDNILGTDTLHTIAQTIVHNQEQDNPPPYLQPPPQTPYDIGADTALQGGRQAVAVLQAILKPLLAGGPVAPFADILFGLFNLGATIGATYGADQLKQSSAQMPTLIVPQDKNQISSLIQAASTYQAQLISSLAGQENLAITPSFFYPLLSNVGLLGALANLNPLVLSSTKAGYPLGPNNPTAAAVTTAAWQTLLPDYFHWVPVDSPTESPSQNFDDFYADATPASPGNALDQLETMQTTGTYNQYPGFDQTAQITFFGPSGPYDDPKHTVKYRDYVPSSMAKSPGGAVVDGGTAHPERFYTLVTASLYESAQGYNHYDAFNGWITDNFSFYTSSLPGLSVVGWELVDANGVEIDKNTAAMVFAVGNQLQPVKSGPALVAAGGGWYLNLGPPTPLDPDSSLYATRANPSEVFMDWFRQASLVPPYIQDQLKIGATVDAHPRPEDNINVAAPTYTVNFYPITSEPPATIAVAPNAAAIGHAKHHGHTKSTNPVPGR